MMKILVTGGAGYVGTSLISVLLRAGHAVRAVDCLMYGGRGLFAFFSEPRFEFVKGDICQEDMAARVLKGVDFIIHLAGLVGTPICERYPDLARKQNVDGSAVIARLRRSDQPIIFASTYTVYGDRPGITCREDTEPSPPNVYSKTKMEAETLLLACGNCVALRFGSAFGASPRFRLDLIINAFVYEAVRKGVLTVYGRNSRKSFIHVLDAAIGILFTIEHFARMRDHVFNCGREENTHSKEDIAALLARSVPFDLRFEEGPEGEYSCEPSYGRMREIGFLPRRLVPDGIEELLRLMAVMDVPDRFYNECNPES